MKYLVLLLSATIISSTPAFAGFEWVPPADNPTAPDYIIPGAPPSLTPPEAVQMIRDNQSDLNRAMQPQPVAAPEERQQQSGILINTAPLMPHSSEFNTPVQGFGESLPLAIALSEIVPAQFSYAFESAVYAGLPVSWDGGNRPWPNVLSDMLQEHGLMASFKGQILMIYKKSRGRISTLHPVVPNAAIQKPNPPSPAPMMQHTRPTPKRVAPQSVAPPAPSPTVNTSAAPLQPRRNVIMPSAAPSVQSNDAPVQLLPMP